METPESRRRTMQAVKSRDTTPELVVRRMLHAAGYRYRLHLKFLPGCPDLVFPSKRKIVFVNGCFWHGHDCLRGARVPKANREYWESKVGKNRKRDSRNLAELKKLGWRVLVLWECETKQVERMKTKLIRFLDG